MQIIIRWIRQHPGRLLALGIWFIAILIFRFLLAEQGITLTDFLRDIVKFVQSVWYGAIIYCLICILRPILFLPQTIFTLIAGRIFGVPLGFLTVYIATLILSGIFYSFARWLVDFDPDRNHSRLERFINPLRKHPIQTVITMELLFISNDIISTLAGSLKIPFGGFIKGVIIGVIPTALAGVTLGASFEGDILRGDVRFDPRLLIISVILLGIGFVMRKLIEQWTASKNELSISQ